jgi:RNA polymerase sigma-70 factor, ECF subfamily
MDFTDRSKDLARQTAEELARRVQQGSKAGFAELAARFGPRLFCYFRQKISSREDCEDLVQETLVKAYRNIGKYRPTKVFSTWLYTIGTRLAVDHFRSQSRRCVASVSCDGAAASTAAAGENPYETAARRDDTSSLWSLARSLPERQRDVLWLRYGEGLAVREIARALGLTRVHVKVLLFRARTGLAKMCEQKRIIPAPERDAEGFRKVLSCR